MEALPYDARMARALIPTLFALSLPFAAAAAAAQDASTGAPKGPPPTPVRVAEVREESLAPRKKVFGELRAARRVTVATEEGGIVRELLVREGDSVAAGAVIARLDDARIRLEIAANAANLAVARAAVGERESQLARAQRDLDLVNRAAAQGGTNPREIADNESALAVAKAQLVQASAAIAVVEQQGAYLAKRLADLEVRAPFAGVVTTRHAERGAWIAAGGMVVDLVDTVNLEGWFDVPQEMYGAAVELSVQSQKHPSRALPVDIETATGSTIDAVGMRVVPEIDQRSRTFHAVLGIGRDDGVALASGIALTAYVPAGAQAPRLLVPKDAVLRGESGPFVYAVRDGIAVPVNVRIAFPAGPNVALEPGALAAGAKVVVEGNERLMPMSPVAPIAAGTEGKK